LRNLTDGGEGIFNITDITKEKSKKSNLVKYGVDNYAKVQIKCLYCDIIGGINGMKKWHFDNCKHSPKFSMFKCSYCHKEVRSITRFNKFHGENCKHRGGKIPFMCDECDYTSYHGGHVNRHKRNKHKNSS